MTRTEAIRDAVFAVLEAKREELNAADDLRSLVIDLKFRAGHSRPRVVVLRRESETDVREPLA